MRSLSPIERLSGDGLALGILVVVAIYAGISVSLPLSAGLRRVEMLRMHHRLPFVAFALLQPSPAMYSFEHRNILTTGEQSEDEEEGDGSDDGGENTRRDGYVIHHPMRSLFSPGNDRKWHLHRPGVHHTLRIISTFWGTRLISTYDVYEGEVRRVGNK